MRSRLLEFMKIWHVKIVRLSALRTGRIYLPEDISGNHLEATLGPQRVGMMKSMNNSNSTIRNRTRNLQICSAVPQPSTPPRSEGLISVISQLNAQVIVL